MKTKDTWKMLQTPRIGVKNNFECDGCSFWWVIGKQSSLQKLHKVNFEDRQYSLCLSCKKHMINQLAYKNFEDNTVNGLLWAYTVVRAENFKCTSCKDNPNISHTLSMHPLGLFLLRRYIHDNSYMCGKCFMLDQISELSWI